MIHLDTHAVVWLYSGETERFPEQAREALEREPLVISPMVVLELQYLYEVARITVPADEILDALEIDLGLTVADTRFPLVVHRATTLNWTRNPFDRIIAAQALAAGVPLMTKDRAMRDQLVDTVWD